MTQEEFNRVSLVGTDKARLSANALDPHLGQMLTAMNSPDPTSELLGVAGVHTLRGMAGYQVGELSEALPSPSEPDELPLCSDHAAGILKRLLLDNPEKQDALVLQWCDACAAAGQRVPPHLLPRLLPFGGRSYKRIPRVLPVVGNRGRWLATNMEVEGIRAQRARALVGAIDRQLWDDSLSRGHVSELFEAWRIYDADAARDALARDYDEMTAKARERIVSRMRVNLSASDERILESFLDGRARQVAGAAAQVLSELPTSAYVARNVERLTGRVGIIKKRRKTSIGTTMFDDLTKDMERDALGNKSKRFHDQDVWFYNAVRSVPPSLWEDELGKSPTEIVPLLFDKSERKLKLKGPFAYGVQEGIVAHKDTTWAVAWLAQVTGQTLYTLNTYDPEVKMAAMLPDEQVEQLVGATLIPAVQRGNKVTERGMNLLSMLSQHPWSVDFSDLVLGYIALLIPNRSFAYILARHLPNFARVCHVGCATTAYDKLMPVLEKSGNPGYLSKPLNEFLLTLKARKDIQDTFAR